MSKAVFYHTDCPVCLEAEAAEVYSVPALLLDGQVFHINFGAALAGLRV